MLLCCGCRLLLSSLYCRNPKLWHLYVEDSVLEPLVLVIEVSCQQIIQVLFFFLLFLNLITYLPFRNAGSVDWTPPFFSRPTLILPLLFLHVFPSELQSLFICPHKDRLDKIDLIIVLSRNLIFQHVQFLQEIINNKFFLLNFLSSHIKQITLEAIDDVFEEKLFCVVRKQIGFDALVYLLLVNVLRMGFGWGDELFQEFVVLAEGGLHIFEHPFGLVDLVGILLLFAHWWGWYENVGQGFINFVP